MTTATTPAAAGLRVTFWGAARTVTGSMHLVEAAGLELLLDCGLFQGGRAEARQRNSHFPFAPNDIDAVILSHAHIDHCGNLPNLCARGFRGPIHYTPATHDLLALMLADSAKIQEEDAAYLNRRRDRGEARVEPLYTRQDIAASGMCEAGRILHHLKHNIGDPRHTVLIIGFQAPETVGRRLVERRPEVRILDRVLKVRAEVVVMNGFSSHADHNDFLTFLGPLAGQTRKVRLVHGEPGPAEALAQGLRTLGFADVGIPERGETVSVD